MNLQSDNINELATALSKAQGELTGALKESTNPFYKNKYADLGSVWEACRLPLSKNGLAVIQQMQYENEKTLLVTTLTHSSGQWMRSFAPVIPTKNDIQGLGAGITYIRRYALCAMIGVTQDDDDGQSAISRRGETHKENKTVPYIPETVVSKEQGGEILHLIEKCDAELKKSIHDYMKNELKVKTAFELPLKQYEKIKKRLLDAKIKPEKTGTEND